MTARLGAVLLPAAATATLDNSEVDGRLRHLPDALAVKSRYTTVLQIQWCFFLVFFPLGAMSDAEMCLLHLVGFTFSFFVQQN